MEYTNSKHDLRICIFSLFTFPACFIGIFFLVGVMILGLGIHSAYFGQQSLAWPTTDGHLWQCSLEEEHHKFKGGEYTSWRAAVEYSYTVEGKSFTSRQLSFGSNNSTLREKQKQICDILKKSSRVKVHYQPSNPGNAVLIVGSDNNGSSCITFGIIWLLIVTGAAWIFIRPIYIIRKVVLSDEFKIQKKLDAIKRKYIHPPNQKNSFQIKELNVTQRTTSLFLFTFQIGLTVISLLILSVVLGAGASYLYSEQEFLAWPAAALCIVAAVVTGLVWYLVKILTISYRVSAVNMHSCLYNACIVSGVLFLIAYIGFDNICIVLFVGAFLGSILWSAYRNHKSLSWPTVNGYVLNLYIVKNIVYTEDGASEIFEVRVEYSYIVNGKQFTGNRISFFDSGSPQVYDIRLDESEEEQLQRCYEGRQRIYNKLKKASRVMVHYNPDNPNDAVLAVGYRGDIADKINTAEYAAENSLSRQ